MKMRQDPWDIATVALLVAALVTVLLTYDDYGITWDEPTFVEYGKEIVLDLAGGDTVEAVESQTVRQIISRYGGLFEWVAAVSTSLFDPDEPYRFRHLINALVGLLGVCGAARLGRWFLGPQGGFYSAAILMLSPVYYGHMFNNSRDIPFAAGYVWSLYFLVRVLTTFFRRDGGLGFGLATWFGITLGLALAVRIGGLLIVAYAGFFLSVGLVLAWRYDDLRTSRILARSCGALAWSFVVAYGIMLSCWPWAREAPLTRPWEALTMMSKFPYRLDVLLAGTWYAPDSIPPSYLPHMLGVQTPEAILFLSLSGLGVAGWTVWHFRMRDRDLALGVAMTLCAALAPIGYIVFRHSVVYDSFRHILFTIPVFCVGAAAALVVAGRWLQTRYGEWGRGALQGLAALAVVVIVVQMVRLHPNQTVYYNRFVGGLAGAHTRYEIDYWGNSTDEALKTLVARLRVECPGQQFGVFSHTHATSITELAKRSDNIRYAPIFRDADFYMGINRGSMLDELYGKPINGFIYFDITRDGVPLTRIRARRVPPCD